MVPRGGRQRGRRGHSGVAGGHGSPVLELGEEVLHLMAHPVKPLAGRDLLVAVPPGGDAGGDALLQRQGTDCVAVLSLVSHQGGGVWQISQREFSTGEVPALPFAEGLLGVPPRQRGNLPCRMVSDPRIVLITAPTGPGRDQFVQIRSSK